MEKGHDEEDFPQLTAAQLITTTKNGMPVRVWRKRRDRNEALDLRVYAMAALERLQVKFKRVSRKMQERVAEAVSEPEQPPVQVGSPEEPKAPVKSEPKKKAKATPRSGGFVNGWR